MQADFLSPYNSDLVADTFEELATPVKVGEQFVGLPAFEAHVLASNARLTACLAIALEQLGCLGREVAELRRQITE